MPNLDQTGPNGKGPMTGRALGKCSGASKEFTVAGGQMPRGRGLNCRRRRDVFIDENKN